MSFTKSSEPLPEVNLGNTPSRSIKVKPPGACEPYLRGPIPWTWLRGAISLGDSAVATGLAIWHLRALTGNLTFKASLSQLRRWTGLSEKATRAGLHRLEKASLAAVDRPAGKSPQVTLVERPADAHTQSSDKLP